MAIKLRAGVRVEPLEFTAFKKITFRNQKVIMVWRIYYQKKAALSRLHVKRAGFTGMENICFG
jgi:hypothetical protein